MNRRWLRSSSPPALPEKSGMGRAGFFFPRVRRRKERVSDGIRNWRSDRSPKERRARDTQPGAVALTKPGTANPLHYQATRDSQASEGQPLREGSSKAPRLRSCFSLCKRGDPKVGLLASTHRSQFQSSPRNPILCRGSILAYKLPTYDRKFAKKTDVTPGSICYPRSGRLLTRQSLPGGLPEAGDATGRCC